VRRFGKRSLNVVQQGRERFNGGIDRMFTRGT
jgi:hypothetical protein